MYVIEHLQRAKNPLYSFEIIPPTRGKSAKDLLDVIEQLLPYEPPFIDVTTHAAESYYEEKKDGNIIRRIRKKRPGTISLCGIIQNRYNIDTVPHLLCRGFTREETEDVMIELNYLGIHNVLAIRGDETNYHKRIDSAHTTNAYAVELVEQLIDLRRGKYLEDLSNSEPMDICIGVGGYPEKHFESPNLNSDVRFLKQKVDAGADYIVSQMFFDNASYFRFVKSCREAGISVPIIPGLKIIHTVAQLTSLPKNFYINLPDRLVDEIQSSPAHAREIGIRWAADQCKELLSGGASCLHFYVMNDAAAVIDVIKRLG